jgi:transcriptional regulator with XRE-family HTH domain
MESDFERARRSLAANVVRLRNRRGWSQQKAADAADIDLKHLQKVEYGSLNPTLRTLVSLAMAFGVTVGTLLRQSQPIGKRPVGRPSGTQRRERA